MVPGTVGGREEVAMKTLILLMGLTALVAGSVADLDARPRRPKKPVEHYTFSPEHLEAKLARRLVDGIRR